jgi:hypothetical protein
MIRITQKSTIAGIALIGAVVIAQLIFPGWHPMRAVGAALSSLLILVSDARFGKALDLALRLIPKRSAVAAIKKAPSMSILETIRADLAADKAAVLKVWNELSPATRSALEGFFSASFKAGLAELPAVDQAALNAVLAAGENPTVNGALDAAIAVEAALRAAHVEVPPGYMLSPVEPPVA